GLATYIRALTSGLAVPAHLRRLDRFLDPLQLEPAQPSDRPARSLQRAARGHDAVRPRRRTDPRRAVHRSAAHRSVRPAHLALVDPDAHLRRVAVHAPVRLETALDVNRALDGVGGRVDGHEETVDHVVHLMTA